LPPSSTTPPSPTNRALLGGGGARSIISLSPVFLRGRARPCLTHATHVRAGACRQGEFCRVVTEMLAGVEYLHGLRIAHRDLKPANLLLCGGPGPGFAVKIADFGLAKQHQVARQLTNHTPTAPLRHNQSHTHTHIHTHTKCMHAQFYVHKKQENSPITMDDLI